MGKVKKFLSAFVCGLSLTALHSVSFAGAEKEHSNVTNNQAVAQSINLSHCPGTKTFDISQPFDVVFTIDGLSLPFTDGSRMPKRLGLGQDPKQLVVPFPEFFGKERAEGCFDEIMTKLRSVHRESQLHSFSGIGYSNGGSDILRLGSAICKKYPDFKIAKIILIDYVPKMHEWPGEIFAKMFGKSLHPKPPCAQSLSNYSQQGGLLAGSQVQGQTQSQQFSLGLDGHSAIVSRSKAGILSELDEARVYGRDGLSVAGATGNSRRRTNTTIASNGSSRSAQSSDQSFGQSFGQGTDNSSGIKAGQQTLAKNDAGQLIRSLNNAAKGKSPQKETNSSEISDAKNAVSSSVGVIQLSANDFVAAGRARIAFIDLRTRTAVPSLNQAFAKSRVLPLSEIDGRDIAIIIERPVDSSERNLYQYRVTDSGPATIAEIPSEDVNEKQSAIRIQDFAGLHEIYLNTSKKQSGKPNFKDYEYINFSVR